MDTHAAPGWNAPSFAPWLTAALDEASIAAFGNPARTFGEGGTIPFMGMLGAMFPDAQFVVTGVLVPGSNAHGPNEFLHLPTARAGHRMRRPHPRRARRNVTPPIAASRLPSRVTASELSELLGTVPEGMLDRCTTVDRTARRPPLGTAAHQPLRGDQ